MLKGKRRQGGAKEYYEKFCLSCGRSSKHPMHWSDGVFQTFLFHSCDSETPASLTDTYFLLKFAVHLILLPILAYVIGIYLVHSFFTEHFFDLPFIRYSFSSTHHPLIKPNKIKLAVSRILFFLGGSIMVICLLAIPPIIWLFPMIPLTLYL